MHGEPEAAVIAMIRAVMGNATNPGNHNNYERFLTTIGSF